jgi:hypothetical protein
MWRLAVLALAGCADLASSDPGLGRPLYVANAQFRPGAFPAATGGPSALAVQPLHQMVVVGQNRETIAATLAPDAHAGIVGIAGQPGTWIVPAGPPDFEAPGFASLHASYGVSTTPGPLTLQVASVDADGRIGEPATADIIAIEGPPPDGQLVVALEWLGAADLDLHVVDPVGGEAWSDNPNTWQKPGPGTPPDPNAHFTGGILDHDGNAGCTRDGQPREDVVWSQHTLPGGTVIDPIIPSGEYVVRVDARSLCGDGSAPWAVTVYSQGEVIGAARGIATSSDVSYEPHGAGAGITALRFSL